MVTAYFSDTETFPLMYMNCMIQMEGNAWKHQDGNCEPMDGVSLETIEKGIKLFNKALGHVYNHAREQQATAKAVLKKAKEEIADEEVDITDLEEAASSEPTKGWHSQAVINLEYELTGETG